MQEPILTVENFSSSYGDRKILNDISIEIYPNDIIAILGTSGCGKTTLLKHMIGLLQSKTGTIKLFNKELINLRDNDIHDVMKNVGVMYQNSALLNSISVADNISIPLEQHTNLPDDLIQEIVKLKLSLVGLEFAYDYSPTELSGGMRKRVALARAIALDPSILFADEPGAGLDPVTAQSLDYLFLSLCEQLGMTLVLVTHEVASIKRIAKKICYLHEGKVLFFGPLEEALTSEIPELKSFFATHDDKKN